jgi:hypothetical protein
VVSPSTAPREIYEGLEVVNSHLAKLRTQALEKPQNRAVIRAKLTDWRLVAANLAVAFTRATLEPDDPSRADDQNARLLQIYREVRELEQEIVNGMDSAAD